MMMSFWPSTESRLLVSGISGENWGVPKGDEMKLKRVLIAFKNKNSLNALLCCRIANESHDNERRTLNRTVNATYASRDLTPTGWIVAVKYKRASEKEKSECQT